MGYTEGYANTLAAGDRDLTSWKSVFADRASRQAGAALKTGDYAGAKSVFEQAGMLDQANAVTAQQDNERARQDAEQQRALQLETLKQAKLQKDHDTRVEVTTHGLKAIRNMTNPDGTPDIAARRAFILNRFLPAIQSDPVLGNPDVIRQFQNLTDDDLSDASIDGTLTAMGTRGEPVVRHAGDIVTDPITGKPTMTVPDKPKDPVMVKSYDKDGNEFFTWEYPPGSPQAGQPAQPPAGASGASGAATKGPGGGFDAVYNGFVKPHEGGYTASDGNGAPAKYGINQTANPDVDVAKLTPEAAKTLLHDRYFVPSGADQISDPRLQAIQFDTAVNMGNGAAHHLMVASGGDPDKYLALREARYRAIAAADPSKVASLPTWLKRNEDLRAYVGGAGADASGDQTTGAAGRHPGLAGGAEDTSGRHYTGGVKQKPPGDPEDAPMTPEIAHYWAQKINSGGTPPAFGNGTVGARNRRMVYDEAARIGMADGGTGSDQASREAAYKADSGSLGKLTAQRGAIKTFEDTTLKNADLALSLAAKGAGQTGSPIMNRWIQAGRKTILGDPDVAAFDAAIGTVADEYAKVMSGSTGGQGSTDSSRSEAYRRLNGTQSPAQLRAVIATMRTEMENRLKSLDDEISATRGRLGGKSGASAPAANNDPTPAVLREIDAMKRSGDYDASQPYGTAKHPFVATDPAIQKKLHKGAYFFDANGHLWQQ